MEAYAFARAKMGLFATEKEISDKIKIAPETISRWKKIKGYSDWLDDAVFHAREGVHDFLDRNARKKIEEGDFRFFCLTAVKYEWVTLEQVERSQDMTFSFVRKKRDEP